jgi:hypothetical protein
MENLKNINNIRTKMTPEEKMKAQVEANKRYRKKKQSDVDYKAKINEYANKYYQLNKEKVNQYQRDYQREIYYPKHRETKNKKVEEILFPDIIE